MLFEALNREFTNISANYFWNNPCTHCSTTFSESKYFSCLIFSRPSAKNSMKPTRGIYKTPNRLKGSLMQTHNRNLPKNPETLAVCELKKSHDLESLDHSHWTVKPWRAKVVRLKLGESCDQTVRHRGWLAVCVWGVVGPGLEAGCVNGSRRVTRERLRLWKWKVEYLRVEFEFESLRCELVKTVKWTCAWLRGPWLGISKFLSFFF